MLFLFLSIALSISIGFFLLVCRFLSILNNCLNLIVKKCFTVWETKRIGNISGINVFFLQTIKNLLTVRFIRAFHKLHTKPYTNFSYSELRFYFENLQKNNFTNKKSHWVNPIQGGRSSVVRTLPLDVIPRVSTSEASGAGFEKVNCLFLTSTIARTFWLSKLDIYMFPVTSFLISRYLHTWKGPKKTP